MYAALAKGCFTVRKTSLVFSNMGVDQAHDQNNKILRNDGGVIGILDNHSTLLKWAIAGPTESHILKSESSENLCTMHHEGTLKYDYDFHQDIDAFNISMLQFGNPFEEEEAQLLLISSRHMLDDTVSVFVVKTKSEKLNMPLSLQKGWRKETFHSTIL